MAKREINVTLTGNVDALADAVNDRPWVVARSAAKECAGKARRAGYAEQANMWADAARTLADTAETLQRVG